MAGKDGTKITLHWLNGSRAQSILWLLEELKAPYELEVYHRQPSRLAPPELQKIHPLGKSPVVTVTSPKLAEPMVLAESGFIYQYLCDHFAQGTGIVPKRWKDGEEGQVGGETESWMRYQYYLNYTEGSLMPYLWLALIMNAISGPAVPWLVRPITGVVAGKVISAAVHPNVEKHLGFLEQQLGTSPDGGGYMCGQHLTAADILLSFPLLAAKSEFDSFGTYEKGTARDTFPKVFEYINRLENEAGFKRSVDIIKKREGTFKLTP